VSLSLRAGERSVAVRAGSVGDGQFEVVGDQLDQAGRWEIAVAVERPSLRDAVLVAPWTVGPSATRLPTNVSAMRLAPLLEPSAWATTVLFVAAALWQRARRRVSALTSTEADGDERLKDPADLV
jgi:hypothetical protein